MINLEKLKKEVKTLEVKNKVNNELNKNSIQINYEYISYTNNEEIDNYLNEKSLQIINIVSKSNIILGKIIYDVQLFLSEHRADETFTYMSWLEANGFNRMTALRYKRRYAIYKYCENDNIKSIISLLPQKYIDELFILDESELIELLDSVKTKKDIIDFVANRIILEKNNDEELKDSDVLSDKDNNKTNAYNFNNRLSHIQSSLLTSNNDKQEKINKLLKAIERILES